MATESMRYPTDAINEAHELARRGAAIAWLISHADEDQVPERTLQHAAEAVADAIEGLERCANELFEHVRAAKVSAKAAGE